MTGPEPGESGIVVTDNGIGFLLNNICLQSLFRKRGKIFIARKNIMEVWEI